MLPSSSSTPLAIAFSLFVVSPLLLFFSLPLFIWGAITVFCSFTALFLRVSLVYIELLLALARNYLLSTPDPSSSLNFKVSEEAHAAPPRSYARGLRRSHQYRPPQGIRTISPAPSPRGGMVWRRRSAGCVDERIGTQRTRKGNTSHQHRTSLPLSTAFSALTSGDQNRDFEGVGGWRIQGSPIKHKLQTQSYPATPGDEADDKTWTSFNQRLELPSLTNSFVPRSTVTATSQGLSISPEVMEEDRGEDGRDGRTWISASTLPSPGDRKRHHRRSVTTSSLPHPNKGEIASILPHSQQRQRSPGSVTWQIPHRGTQSISFTSTAPAHIRDVSSEGYFSLVREGDGAYTALPSGESANIGKSMKRIRRRSLSSKKPPRNE